MSTVNSGGTSPTSNLKNVDADLYNAIYDYLVDWGQGVASGSALKYVMTTLGLNQNTYSPALPTPQNPNS
jgi:hypothetical protein